MSGLAEKVESRRFLGREWLTWLWLESELFEGRFDVEGIGTRELYFEKAITLETPADSGADKESSRLTGLAPTGREEAKEALRQGKLPVSAKVVVARGDQTFSCTVKADALGLSGVKIPALLKEEGDDPFFERIGLIEELEGLLDALFRAFLAVRLSKSWAAVAMPAMKAWAWLEDGAPEPEAIAAYRRLRARSGIEVAEITGPAPARRLRPALVDEDG
jgi:hypothetical protein